MAGKLIVDLLGIPVAFYFQSADPAVANPTHLRTGIHWIDTTSNPYTWKRRNVANDGWDTLGKVRTDAEFLTDVKTVKLDDLAAPDDNTDLNASTSTHGLLKKLSNNASEFLNGQGNFTIPAGAGDVVGPSSSVDSEIALFNSTTGKLIKRATTTGLLKATSGVLSAAVVGTDYSVPTASINAQTGTTYTLQASDNGGIVTCSNASAITVTVPSGLGAGFNCLVIQKGAGQITFSPSSTTVNNRQSHTKSAGQHAICTLAADVANNFYLGGDTAA